jgi:hypothetical protein
MDEDPIIPIIRSRPVRRFRTAVGFTIHFDGLPTLRPSEVVLVQREKERGRLSVRSHGSTPGPLCLRAQDTIQHFFELGLP